MLFFIYKSMHLTVSFHTFCAGTMHNSLFTCNGCCENGVLFTTLGVWEGWRQSFKWRFSVVNIDAVMYACGFAKKSLDTYHIDTSYFLMRIIQLLFCLNWNYCTQHILCWCKLPSNFPMVSVVKWLWKMWWNGSEDIYFTAGSSMSIAGPLSSQVTGWYPLT